MFRISTKMFVNNSQYDWWQDFTLLTKHLRCRFIVVSICFPPNLTLTLSNNLTYDITENIVQLKLLLSSDVLS